MEKTIGCIIARTKSKRLPKKVLRKINGKTLIEYIITKMKKAKNIDIIYLCTSVDLDDKILLKIAEQNGIKAYAGGRDAVIDRMLNVAKIENASYLIRITGDNIFCDEIFIDQMIKYSKKYDADYIKTVYLPIGTTAEIYSVTGLKNLYHNLDPDQTEYLSYYILFKKNNLKKLILIPPKKFQKPYYSLTVDTPADLERTKFIINNLKNPKGIYLDEILDLSNHLSIPNLKIEKNLQVKIPNNEIITYEEYRKVVEEQYEKCEKIQLKKDFYEKNK